MNRSPNANSLILMGAATLTATLVMLGIGCSGDPKEPQTRYTENEMQAQKLPYTEAYLNYLGTLTETKMSAVNRSGEVDFLFMVDDALHDKESYSYNAESFRFTGNSEEQYSPGITLLKFPFETGDKWKWSGTYRFGGIDRKATAQVTTSFERLATLAGEYETVLVVCDLEIESGSVDPVSKELKFWFAPGKGLIRREIEHSLTREPMPARFDDEE